MLLIIIKHNHKTLEAWDIISNVDFPFALTGAYSNESNIDKNVMAITNDTGCIGVHTTIYSV